LEDPAWFDVDMIEFVEARQTFKNGKLAPSPIDTRKYYPKPTFDGISSEEFMAGLWKQTVDLERHTTQTWAAYLVLLACMKSQKDIMDADEELYKNQWVCWGESRYGCCITLMFNH
jgi:hypothetical protein